MPRPTSFLRRCARLVMLFCALVPSLAAAETGPLHPALWKVREGATTIYLFGTIHMLPPHADWLNGPVAQAADASDEIATEILDEDGSATRQAVATRAPLPAGTHLGDMLSPERKSALGTRLRGLGYPEAALDGLKPWFAAVTLSTLPLFRRGFASSRGVEAMLTAREAGRNIRRSGIETPDGQLAILDGLPQANQIAYLGEVIDEFDHIDPLIDAMFAAWGKGDAQRLAHLMNDEEGKDDPLLTRRLITERNRTFAAWVETRLHEAKPATIFVAVGAGHLAGTDSVIDDLARDGIHAERVQ